MVRLVVKATLSGSSFPRRTSFPDAFALDRQDLALRLARSFSLQPGSFRLAYRDDDNDLVELVSTDDLREALDYFSSDASASSSASTSGWFGVGAGAPAAEPDSPECITLKLELLVHYDGPSLSESGSSVYSLGASSRSRSGSSSAGSDDSRGWASLRIEDAPVPRSRRALSAGSSATDAESDRWILRTAYSDSRAPGVRGRGGRSELQDERDGEDEDDWDGRTVSSASQAFGAARPRGSRRTARHRDSVDGQRIPPALDSRGDALSPNFAIGHFTPADPHPYPRYSDRNLAHAPSYSHLHGAYPPPPFHAHHLPPPPHFAHGHPLPFFPPLPHAHRHALYVPPPHPGFFPGATPSDYPPPPASSFAALSLGSAGAWASPTASQRDRARDLFASSSEGRGSAGDGGSARRAARPEEDELEGAEPDERASSYTVTSSGDGRAEGDEQGDAGEGSGAQGGAFLCVVCGDEISGPRYSCAVCEAFDLCQECERLPDPSSSSSSTAHDPSHILLKIPVASAMTSAGSRSSASASSIKAAVSRAATLAHPSTRSSTAPSTAHELAQGPPASSDVAEYWSWWSAWYGPHAHAHLRAAYHPPPPPSSWSASAAGPVAAAAPPAASAQQPVEPDAAVAQEAPVAPVAVPAPPGALALPPAAAPPLPPPAPAPPALGSTPYPLPPAPPVPPPPPPVYPLASRQPPVRALASYGLYEYANHGVACRHCSRIIPGPSAMGVLPTADGKERGVRWLCANCPTSPSYDLCPDCEPLSQQIHDPTHAFLRITHPIRRPLPSVRALLPVLYARTSAKPPSAAASASVRGVPERDLMDLQSESSVTSVDSDGSGSSGGSARTRVGSTEARARARAAGPGAGAAVGDVINHGRVMCDACGRRVMGIWMACCHCPTSFDLCMPCLLAGASIKHAHNPAHVFVALKRPVDFALHERLTRHQSRRPRGLLEVDLYA